MVLRKLIVFVFDDRGGGLFNGYQYKDEEDRHEVQNELDKETVYADVLHFLEGTIC